MKIAQVVCVSWPYKGGIGTMAANHARSLAQAGHQVDLLSPHYNQALPKEEKRDGYRIVRLKPIFANGNAAFCPKIYNRLKDYDVVHLHYPFFGVAELVFLWKFLRGKKAKLAVTYHMDVVGEGLMKVIFKVHRWIFLPLLTKLADKIIVTSIDYAQHSFISRWLNKFSAKFIAIPPEVDDSFFISQENQQEIRQRHGIGLNDRVILFVGGLDKAHYFKGLDILMRAVANASASLNNLKLVVVGEGELKTSYQQQAKALAIGEHVIFAGGVPHAELPSYYSMADFLTVSAIDKSEAFGIVSIESLSCGKPILVSDLPGVRTVAEGGVGMVYKTGDVDDLSNKITEMFSGRHDLRRMGQLGRSKVEREYSVKIVLEKLLNVYNQI